VDGLLVIPITNRQRAGPIHNRPPDDIRPYKAMGMRLRMDVMDKAFSNEIASLFRPMEKSPFRLSVDWYAVILSGLAAVCIKLGVFPHIPW
jgi:hypothetical protein